MRKSGSGAGVSAMNWKLVVAGMATLLLAGCSDSVERFSGNYSNPSDADPVYTASIPKYKPKYRAPAYQEPAYQSSQNDDSDGIVQSPVASAPVAKAPSYDYTQAYSKTYRQPQVIAQTPVQTTPAYPAPKYSYNTPPAAPSYQKPAYKRPVIVDEQVADADPAPVKRTSGGRVTVGDGVTLYAIAKANHMTVKQLADANNIRAPYTVAPGRVILVPGVSAPVVPAINLAAAAPVQAQPVIAEDVAPAPANGSTYVVARGDTLFSVGRKFSISPFAIADANRLPHDKPLPLGKTLRIPMKNNVAAAKQVQPVIQDDNQDEIANSNIPQKKGAVLQQDNSGEIADDSAPAAAPQDAQLAMRWPVRGKVISGFGPKSNGMKNEGINISVPEGTSVQAAEAGVIAYAGNELKGYGNLILIRHAGGYVTAYAHTSQILVKKGDIVKRGDVIAKSGQTGAVQSPQLHFEVRKGATPLNPSTFLNSATASN